MTKYSLAELRNLQDDDELDLSASQLHDFPNPIIQLTRLTKLDLSSNSIPFLPENFCKMTRLIRIDLGNNHLHHLPDGIGQLTSLQHLNLYNNEIEDLPMSFANLKSLKWLDLKKNPLNRKLAEEAGKCSTDAECKVAAKQVVNVYMADKRKQFDKLKEKEEKVRKQVQQAQEEERIRKYAEKVARGEVQKKEKKDVKNREAAKAAAQAHTQTKAPKPVPTKQASPKKQEVKQVKKQSSGIIVQTFSFIWKVIFYCSVALVTSSTIAIGLDCSGYGTPIPGNGPLCKDVGHILNGRKPSNAFTDNVKSSYITVFGGYQYTLSKQIKPYAIPLQNKLNAHFNDFSKTDIGKKVVKIYHQIHSFIVKYLVKAQRFVKQQHDAFVAWWAKEGKKKYGGFVDGFVLGLKVVLNVVIDIAYNIYSFFSHVALRLKNFFVAFTEGGFNAAMNTLNR